MRKSFYWLAWAALLLAGCIGPAPVPTSTPTTTAIPVTPTAPQPSSTVTAIPPTPTVTPTPLSAPAVLGHFALAGQAMGETLTTSPGRVWVGTDLGTIEEHDAATGALVKVHKLVDGSPDNPSPISSMAFDGQHLWVLVASTVDGALVTQLFVLDTGGNALLQTDLSDSEPRHLGMAPGQIWMQGQVFSTSTQQPTLLAMDPAPAVFAYDGAGWMWVAGGTTCDSCPTHIYRYKTDGSTTASPGPAASPEVQAILTAGQRIWAVTAFNKLDGYDPSGTNLGLDTQPLASVDLNGEMESLPVAVAYDGHMLWLLAGTGKGGGMLYQRDAQSGGPLGTLQVGDSDGNAAERARIPVDLAFNGRDLWVLTAYDLVQVGLPWTR